VAGEFTSSAAVFFVSQDSEGHFGTSSEVFPAVAFVYDHAMPPTRFSDPRPEERQRLMTPERFRRIA